MKGDDADCAEMDIRAAACSRYVRDARRRHPGDLVVLKAATLGMARKASTG